MDPVETFIEQVRAIHLSRAGVPETSYYPALSNLFDEIGKTLNPKVRCIINLANRGAGLPDGGLFTADQLRRTAEADAFTAQVPARGAIEVKPPDASVDEIVKTPQLARYLESYRQVLVTNLRDFALFGREADGKTVELERASLAADERLFWESVQHPRALAQREGPRLVECLKRVMLHAAPLAAPQDLAVTAGWGHAGKGGVTMPGKGRATERAYGDNERAAIEAGVVTLGLSTEQAFTLLGERCLDVALNDHAYWRCVPSRVWEYTIGGYQVLKKWLSYRERPLLGRDLKPEEARYFTEVARRIAAILLLSPALDENYRRVKENTFDWASLKAAT